MAILSTRQPDPAAQPCPTRWHGCVQPEGDVEDHVCQRFVHAPDERCRCACGDTLEPEMSADEEG